MDHNEISLYDLSGFLRVKHHQFSPPINVSAQPSVAAQCMTGPEEKLDEFGFKFNSGNLHGGQGGKGDQAECSAKFFSSML